MRVISWGTYDTGKPRFRITLRGLKENGIELIECHQDVWSGVEDKSQVKGAVNRLRILFTWFISYPRLIFRYLRSPRHDAVLVGYLGHLDILVLWAFAKWKGVPIIWDAFLSLYNTIVEDRKLVGRWNPVALLLYGWEWLACRAADLVVLDTKAHSNYFIKKFRLDPTKCSTVFVGAEPESFPQALAKSKSTADTLTILFYGQFIPLHGISTIVDAARLTKGEDIRWVIIGKGQEEAKIRGILAKDALSELKWIPWVNYQELTEWIRDADICLGIFGDTDKASMVIPNKVFQILMSGKPVITRDSPAIRELLHPNMPGVWLIPHSDAVALANTVRSLRKVDFIEPLHSRLREKITPLTLGAHWKNHILNLLDAEGKGKLHGISSDFRP
jgi:glycosyltransferase involved in cell wall biosynthesis